MPRSPTKRRSRKPRTSTRRHHRRRTRGKGTNQPVDYIRLRPAYRDIDNKYHRTGNTSWSAKYYIDQMPHVPTLQNPLELKTESSTGNNMYIVNIFFIDKCPCRTVRSSWHRFDFQIQYYYSKNKLAQPTAVKTDAWQVVASSDKLKKQIYNLVLNLRKLPKSQHVTVRHMTPGAQRLHGL